MEEDIAVIGLGLRFPGDAANPEELWKVLENGESQWSEIPKERVNVDGYYHPSGERQGSIPFRSAHLIKGNIAAFDAPFFSIPSDDAEAIDPQQRMLLEVSYEALENAGLRKEDISGTNTCVYVGSFVKDYEQICLRDPDWAPRYAATGNGVAIMANRISYFYNLHGPSMTIDTGCSGSLVSVHLGAQSLRNRESSIAIAAGAGMILTPSTMMPMTALNFLSPDGKCFTFDSRANGYGRGEGIGVVVMKRLSDAIRDNDTIRAVIRGSSVNQDGRTTGITLPSKEAQVANIRSVYANAGLDFDQTAYVECHGTGTQAGDWRELKAISETLAAGRFSENPVVVGSVKPNIGHLEGAAGVAGMIKGVLVLEKGKIPPNINFKNGNPAIDFDKWKVKVPLSVMDWPLSGLRRVSVNCFGFGGTNAHVILDEAPEYLHSRGLIANHSSKDCPASVAEALSTSNDKRSPNDYHLFCYSSNEKSGVKRIMSAHAKYIKSRKDACMAELLRHYSYTLGCRRSILEWKGFVIAKSASELAAKLEETGSTNPTRTLRKGKPRIAFIFAGQGSQWAQMGRDLMAFDVFRRSMEEASSYIMQELQSPFDLLREIFRDRSETMISYPHISQPATTAIQVALVDLFHSFGIAPKHVVGHSSGEIAAAYAGGAISRSTAWEIAYFRGVAAICIPLRAPKLKGAMMAVGMSFEETKNYLKSGSLLAEIACVNSPSSITISGRVEHIEWMAQDLAAKNISHRVLSVQTAYHSSHMRFVEHDYRNSLSAIQAREMSPEISMFSSVTGRFIKGSELNSQYWADNMISPVQYLAAMTEMMTLPVGKRPDIVIELSPSASLRSPTSDIMQSIFDDSSRPTYYSTMQPKGDGVSKLLAVFGALWVQECSLDMKQVTSRGQTKQPKCLTDLPPYPWNHTKSYWHESHLSVANRERALPRQDLIGSLTADSNSFEPRWRGFLRISENPWIQDHQVQKTIVYPAAGMISMTLEGAKQIRPQSDKFVGYEITDMSIERAMIIPSTPHGLEVALNIKLGTEFDQTQHGFSIYSKQLNGAWERNANGYLRFRQTTCGSVDSSEDHNAQLQKLSGVCKTAVNPRQLYELLDTIGMNYGPSFRNISDVYQGDGACLYTVHVPDTKSKMPAKFEYPHVIHPATLDSMFHSLFAIEAKPMVPTFFRSIYVSEGVHQNGPKVFSGYATANRVGLQEADAKIVMSGPDYLNQHIVLDGLHLTALNTSDAEQGGFLPSFRNLSVEVVWKEDAIFASFVDKTQVLDLLAHKFPGLSVLQVGGTVRAALDILHHLAPAEDTPRLSRFTVLDTIGSKISSELLPLVRGSRKEPFVESIEKFADISSDYHLIIYSDEDGVKIEGLKTHLKIGGILMPDIPEISESHSAVPHTNGTTNGAGTGDSKQRHSLSNGSAIYQRPARSETAPQIILLTPESPNEDISAFVISLKNHKTIASQGYKVSILTLGDVLKDSIHLGQSIVISLLDVCPSMEQHSSLLYWDEEHFDLLKSIQKSAMGMIWVTRGSHMKPDGLEGSAVIGLARVLMSEDPRRFIVTFDLDTESRLGSPGIADNIMAVFTQTFCEENAWSYVETEFAEKDGVIFIPRMRPIRPLNNIIEGRSPRVVKDRAFHPDPVLSTTVPEARLSILKPGLSDDSWHYTEFNQVALLPDEVDIRFMRTVLTSRDVETLLGRTVESTIGLDLIGIVTAVGGDVKAFTPGDEVTALVPNGSIQSIVRVKSQFVQNKLPGFVPSLFTSAYYALIHMGRAKATKTVLIHSGASAHGLAAIEIAKSVGAKILTTVTGEDSSKQQETLENYGIPADSIFNDEGGEFVHGVMAASEGKGVDIIYNTTPNYIKVDAKCVKSCGIIVQLTSGTPHSLGHKIDLGNSSVTVANFDLHQLLRDDGALVAELLDSVSRLLSQKNLNGFLAAPFTTDFGIGHLSDALNHVHRNPYNGLCTVSALPEDNLTVRVVCSDSSKSLRDAIDPDGTYLLAGGFGGLGRSIAELLVQNGAKHLAFVSRSGDSSASSQSFIESLQDRRVHVKVYRVDICDEASLRATMTEKISVEMPPLRGVFQCAAVIQDGMFENMTHSSWQAALNPKVAGSWNLVKTTSDMASNPFFVFLASSAGVIGNRGQANYAAGNSFQDALAHHCRLRGKHAVSIDLGPVLGAGMLTRDEDILDKLRASGFYGIRHEDFLTVIKHAITMEMGPLGITTPAQIILGVGTGGLLRQNKPADPYWSRTALYAYLNLIDMPSPDLSATGADSRNMNLRTALAHATSTEAAADLVRNGLANMLAKAMNLLPEEVDVNRPPNAYGVDSLVAVGVRNWVLSDCAVEVSVFEVLSNDTIGQMANMIVERGDYGGPTA
ncbi:hypothetical protein QQS21_003024 [Conoideocrella luteorostrata]|uniref:Polyketide synthase n=1 Tax=Conoideocrella luteorostrata TaxID=1105319 RepID=A0AAJ0CWM4_9HYPO|nr:hypothetical protein QQS21_003024 [Conoideocrella luteorostrata]